MTTNGSGVALPDPQRENARRRTWMHLRDVGPLPLAGLAQRTGLSLDDTARAVGELVETSFVGEIVAAGQTRYAVRTVYHADTYHRRRRQMQRDKELATRPAELQTTAAGVCYSPPGPATPSAAASPQPPAPRQATLFDDDPPGAAMRPPRAHAGSPTSQAAAAKARNTQGPRCRQVVECLRQHGPMTRDEIQRLTNMPQGTVDGRCADLIEAGYILDTGEERPTRYGTPAGVLALNPNQPYPD